MKITAEFVAFWLQKQNLSLLVFMWGAVGYLLNVNFMLDEYEVGTTRRLHLLAGLWKHNKVMSIALTLVCAYLVSNAMQMNIVLVVYSMIATVNTVGMVYETAVALILSAYLNYRVWMG